MDELRAKDLAAIEPPSSISKIVEFAQQLSFGQQGLFASAELPAPPITARSLASQTMAQQLVARPYSFFPGANGEGIDTLMSRYTIRSRDIQDFTRWLVSWNDTRTQLQVSESPEQYFLHRATPEMIEHFQETPEVQRVVLQGSRRTRVIEHEVHETETETHVTKVHRTIEERTIEEEEPARPSFARRRFGGHPRAGAETSESGDAWKDEASEAGERPIKSLSGSPAGPAGEAPAMDIREAITGVNRGLTTTNVGLGSLAFGVIRGRADMAASMQAQAAASNAVQGSPVSPYFTQQPYLGQPAPAFGGPVAGPSQVGQAAFPGGAHFPPPGVYVSSSPEGPPAGVTTDWPGAPMYQQRGASVPAPSLDGDEDMVLVPRDAAEEKGIMPLGSSRAPRSVARGAAVAAAAAALIPAAYAGGGQTAGATMLPGFAGAASQAFAGTVAARATSAAPGALLISLPGQTVPGVGSPLGGMAEGPGGSAVSVFGTQAPVGPARFAGSPGAGDFVQGPPGSQPVPAGHEASAAGLSPRGLAALGAVPALAGEVAARSLTGASPAGPLTVMPPGTLPRRNVMGSVSGAEYQPMLKGLGSEKAVQTPIPADPLLGQITLVSPPVQVASQASEQAGSAVAFGVKHLAKGTGALDASGLAMLKNALPPGAQAIYPALPQGQLGPQAVNLPLAPSLLNQILTGYGPQAAAMTGTLASAASSAASAHAAGAGGAMPAKIVPTAQRPTDASSGPLAGHASSGPGSLAHAGAAGASTGGALGFLGMPVRLAPSLSGDANVKQAAEARKVLPAGAAAIVRPNEFTALRNKVFTGMNTVHAEPDKTAWRQAAPSFGLRDAEPHTILSPDARVKPPHPSAPIPQMAGGGGSALSKALSAATVIAPAASAALGHTAHPLGGPLLQRAGEAQAAAGLGAMPSFQFKTATPAGPSSPGLGNVRFTSPTIGGQRTPGRPFVQGATSSLPRSSGMTIGSRGAAAATSSTRIASRFTPEHPSIGGGPTATVHESPGSVAGDHTQTSHESLGHPEGQHTPVVMAPMGGLRSLAIPAVKPSSPPAMPSMTGFSSSAPSMARPAAPTTAGGGAFSGSLSTPSSFSSSAPATRSSSSYSSSSSGIASHAPGMPIATSVPARPSQAQSQVTVQRAQSGAVHANRTEHSAQSSEETTNPQAQDPGAAAHEINLLANEVWGILKRKVLHEAERTGKRF